jgi:hypothetical protein
MASTGAAEANFAWFLSMFRGGPVTPGVRRLCIASYTNSGHSYDEVTSMYEPKKDSPRWLLAIYPYLSILRPDRRLFFKVLTGRIRFWWHYSWETNQAENESTDHADSEYEPGSFIRYKPESSGGGESYRIKKSRHGISAIVLNETDKQQDGSTLLNDA